MKPELFSRLKNDLQMLIILNLYLKYKKNINQ